MEHWGPDAECSWNSAHQEAAASTSARKNEIKPRLVPQQEVREGCLWERWSQRRQQNNSLPVWRPLDLEQTKQRVENGCLSPSTTVQEFKRALKSKRRRNKETKKTNLLLRIWCGNEAVKPSCSLFVLQDGLRVGLNYSEASSGLLLRLTWSTSKPVHNGLLLPASPLPSPPPSSSSSTLLPLLLDCYMKEWKLLSLPVLHRISGFEAGARVFVPVTWRRPTCLEPF